MTVTSQPPRANILIVDDELDNLSVLSDTLTQRGYKVRKALSGALALSSIHFSAPDLILLDIKMPDMNGFEVCRTLKSSPDTNDIPIIFLSILSDPSDVVQGFNLGGVDYITKPFRTEEVLARVDRQITLQNLQRQLKQQNLELKSKNNMLTMLNQELQRASQAKDDFLSTASHELRTPLANMKMAMQMLGVSQTPEKIQKYMDILEAELDWELELVSDLLDLQRLTRKVSGFAPSSVRLQTWLPSLAESFLARAREAGQSITVAVPEDLEPPRVPHDDLQRIVVELLNNACKYTPPNGSISMTAREISLDSPSVDTEGKANPPEPNLATEIRVTNTSPKIPNSELEQFFEQFYRSPSSHLSAVRSSGLGLSLVKRMVARSQGTISASYQDGEVVFSLVFPKT